MQKLGIKHSFTSVAIPACNGKIERVDRTMRSILRSHEESTKWPLFLPFVVLAINTHFEQNFHTTSTFRAYGFSIITPGIRSFSPGDCERFTPFKRNITARKEYLSPLWEKATHAYVEILKKKHKLSPLFRGPYKILAKGDRSMTTDMDGTIRRISYLHLYPVTLPETLARTAQRIHN